MEVVVGLWRNMPGWLGVVASSPWSMYRVHTSPPTASDICFSVQRVDIASAAPDTRAVFVKSSSSAPALLMLAPSSLLVS